MPCDFRFYGRQVQISVPIEWTDGTKKRRYTLHAFFRIIVSKLFGKYLLQTTQQPF